MILKKYKNNLRPLFTILALITTMLWWGANTTNAQTPANRGTLHDFTGSGRTSFVTLGNISGDDIPGGPIIWRIAANPPITGSNPAFIRVFNYGINNMDAIVPENYSGTDTPNPRTDPTVWRAGIGTFFVAQTPIGTGGITIERAVQWGQQGDNPRGIGDYDGDGRTDYTVVRNVNNVNIWFIMSSSTNTMRAIPFGSRAGLNPPSVGGGFKVFPGADFNNDGIDELVYVTGANNGTRNTYNIGDARTGQGLITRDFGTFNDDFSIPPDDYTGDGKADFVVSRQTQGSQAIWFILDVERNTFTATPFGIADPDFIISDLPVRGDFDGDKRHDIAVYRESNQTFYWINSSDGVPRGQKAPAEANDFPLGALDNF
ncbi:MAG: VCBS repeat-containing protein [Pyrinomonadaceae bacterium]